MLKPIRDVYIALHRDTDSAPTPSPAPTNIYIQGFASLVPSSFPLCKIHCHHPDSAPHTHDVSASTTCAHAVLHDHDNAALFPSFLSSSPDTPSSSASAPLPVDETFIDVLPPDHRVHDISVAVSTLFAYQTTLQCGRIIATPPDPVTALATPGGIDAFARIVPLSTSQPSASNPPPSPKASTSHIPSDFSDVPSSPTPTPNLDDVLLTGPPLSSDSAVTGSDHTPSSPENHSSVPAPAAEGEGSVSAVLCMETDALCPSSAIRKDIMTAPDLSPQPPPPSSVTDLAIAGPSWRSLGAEHTEDYPPQYDIV
ncbi:hypothetical protein EDB84DRAFT_1512297 [Lactarius hengduanensis]|nr:hypothetical protein EDB84DRAFT_1512297 [Lactarius hengduanensis]